MRRRDILAASGAVLIAGCGDSLGSSSRFAGDPCPSVGGSPRTCYHTAGIRELVLEPDAEYLDSPVSNRFRLHNRRVSSVDIPMQSPLFARHLDGRWQRVPNRRQDEMGVVGVTAGGSIDIGLVQGEYRTLPDVHHTHAFRFGAGSFVFGVRPVRRSMPALARFDVGGEALSASAPEDLVTEQDGATVTVGREPDSSSRYTLTFEAVPDADDSLRLAPEILASRPDLRAAAILRRDGVDTVRVRGSFRLFRTPVEWLDVAGVWDGGDGTYAIDGATFTVSQQPRRNTS